MMLNYSSIAGSELEELSRTVEQHRGLGDVLRWGGTRVEIDMLPQIVAEVLTQDEFTHDVIVPYRNVYLVYDTT